MSEKPDLVTFVRARLDERELLARHAKFHAPGHWTYDPETFSVDLDFKKIHVGADVDGRFIAANDPAYVLLDIAAKRAVCDGYDFAAHQVANATFTGVEDAAKVLVEKQQLATLTQVLKIFAAVNETHADYNPEWRPS